VHSSRSARRWYAVREEATRKSLASRRGRAGRFSSCRRDYGGTVGWHRCGEHEALAEARGVASSLSGLARGQHSRKPAIPIHMHCDSRPRREQAFGKACLLLSHRSAAVTPRRTHLREGAGYHALARGADEHARALR
jgi:hypothetical protein